MLRCWTGAGGAAGPRARRRGQGCRPGLGLSTRHEAHEAVAVHKPGRGVASGAPTFGGGGVVGRELPRWRILDPGSEEGLGVYLLPPPTAGGRPRPLPPSPSLDPWKMTRPRC